MILKILLIVFFPLFLTLLCVRGAFTEKYVEFVYSRTNLPPDSMSYQLRLSIAKLGLRSVLSDKGMEEFKKSGLFNQREIKHMEDVKRLLSFFFSFLYMGLPFFLLGLLWLRSLKEVGKVLFFGSLLFYLFAFFVLLVSLIDYEWIFVAFHNLFFDPYSWRFFDEDMLLRVYPMDFWYKATLYVIPITLLLNSFFGLLGFFMWKRFS